MTDIINADTLRLIEIILAVGIGWIILRFLFKLARKIFAFGCFVIVLGGIVLLVTQFLGGM